MLMNVDCLLAVDFGSLSTRVVASRLGNDYKPVAFVMESHISVASAEMAKEYASSNLGASYPENLAWVKSGEDSLAVGYLASSKFPGHRKINQAKYESAVYKALACIWVVSRKLKLGNSFSVALNVLFPSSELGDRDRFFKFLRDKCKKFETPSGELSVEIVDGEVGGFSISSGYPEGVGIAFKVRRSYVDKIKNLTVPIVMMGFRNVSVVLLARGAMNSGSSSNLGMMQLVDRVKSECGDYDEEALAGAVFEVGTSSNRTPLLRLARSSDNKARSAEASELMESLKKHRNNYALQVIDWLNESLPNNYDALVFCGGTAEYLKPELESAFNSQLLWHGGVEVPQQLDCGLGHRMADLYGLYSYLEMILSGLLVEDKDEVKASV